MTQQAPNLCVSTSDSESVHKNTPLSYQISMTTDKNVGFKSIKWALEQDAQTPLQKLILISLADCLNEDNGNCFPSISYLQEKAQCSRRGAINALKNLEVLGLIKSFKSQGKSTYYTISTGALSAQSGELSAPPTSALSAQTGALSAKTSALSAPEPISNLEVTYNKEREAPTKLCPPDFIPNPDLLRTARFDRALNIEDELFKFKNHEFLHAKSDWDRAFLKWLATARPTKQNGRPGAVENMQATHSMIREKFSDE